MLSVAKVATPLTTATVVVPPSVAPLVPVPAAIATVTLPTKVGTKLPKASCALTCTAGVIVAAADVVVGCTVNASTLAAAGVMLNAVLATAGSPLAVAVSVYPVPLTSMNKVPKVATPFTAATAVVPPSVAPRVPVPAAIATVTLPTKVGTRLPKASCALTCTAGVIVAAAGVVVGCTVKASTLAAAGVMLNAVLATAGSPLAVAVNVYPVPLTSMNRVPKVATPATAATAVVPPSTAPLVPVPGVRATVTVPVKVGTGFPNASSAVTFTAGVIWRSATVVTGCTVNASRVAVPLVMLKLALEPAVRPVAVAVSA